MSYRLQTLFALLSLAGAAVAGGHGDAVLAARADALPRPEEERHASYYFKVNHWPKGEDRKEQWQLLSSLFNGTSHRRRVVRPTVLLLPEKPGGPLEEADGLEVTRQDWQRAALVKVDIRKYGFDKKVLEKLRLVEPHFHFRDKKFPQTKVRAEAVIAPGVAPGVAPAVTPAVAADESLIDGVQFFKEGDRGALVEVRREEIKEGEVVFVREAAGAALRRTVAVKRKGARQPQAKVEVKAAEQKADDVLHGGWLPVKEIDELSKLTRSASPLQLADWAWWQMSVQTRRDPGPGYYDLLEVKDQQSFFERVAFDEKLFKEKFKEFVNEFRAAQKDSGVSQQPRRIAVFDKIGGEFWFTFDNEIAIGDRNPLETPDDGFKFDASEQMAHLPNGWLAQGLFNFKGEIQNTAPDTVVVGDKTATGMDGRIHAGICWRCHDQGLKPVKDHFQKVYKRPLRRGDPDNRNAIVDPKKAETFEEQYFGRLQEMLQVSTDRHAAAVKEATGLTLPQYSALIAKWWKRTEDDGVTLERAARELDCTPERFLFAWKLYKAPGSLNGSSTIDVWLSDPKDTVPVRQWWDSIGEAHKALAASK